MPINTPAKRGPGRPRKVRPPDPPESKTFVNETVAINSTDALDSAGAPLTATEVAALIDVPVAVVTTILDGLVSKGELVLGDDERYWFEGRPAPGAEGSTLSGPGPETPAPEPEPDPDPDDEALTILKAEAQTVWLPTSDLMTFLTHVNLPPQMLYGLGDISSLSGLMSFEVIEPTEDDPHPKGSLRVVINGTHSRSLPLLNPNQSGYVSPTARTFLPPLTPDVEP